MEKYSQILKNLENQLSKFAHSKQKSNPISSEKVILTTNLFAEEEKIHEEKK